MRRLKSKVMTMPFVMLAALSVDLPRSLADEVLSPDAATELLAAAQEINTKCSVLSPSAEEELTGYVARAELATVNRLGVEGARRVIGAGKAQAKGASCDSGSRTLVEGTLEAARHAHAEAESRAVMAAEKSAEKPTKAEKRAAKPLPREATAAVSGGLQSYGRQAMAYYVERRCAHLSSREANRFWRLIVARHKEALRQNGVKAVRLTLRRAEAAAAGKSCGSRTAQLVKQNYAALSR
jgi:hypothetical protein